MPELHILSTGPGILLIKAGSNNDLTVGEGLGGQWPQGLGWLEVVRAAR